MTINNKNDKNEKLVRVKLQQCCWGHGTDEPTLMTYLLTSLFDIAIVLKVVLIVLVMNYV
jgi:hypothetical protein